jgi:enolase-phosphatase E1
VGAKNEMASYANIVKAIGCKASEILFLSDIEAELDAARAAGMQTTWLVREAGVDSNATHPQVTSFTDIL